MITPGGPVPGHLCLYVDGLGTAPLLVDPGFGDSPRVPLPATFDKPVTDRSYGDRYTLVKNDGSQFGQAAEHAKRFNAILMRERKVGISSSPMVDLCVRAARASARALPCEPRSAAPRSQLHPHPIKSVPPRTPPPPPSPGPLSRLSIGMDTPPASAEMTPAEPVYLCALSDDCAMDCDEFQAGIANVLAPENPFSQKRMTIMLNATGFTFVGKDYVKTVAHGKEVSRTKLATEKAYREALEAAAGIKLAP